MVEDVLLVQEIAEVVHLQGLVAPVVAGGNEHVQPVGKGGDDPDGEGEPRRVDVPGQEGPHQHGVGQKVPEDEEDAVAD